MSLLFVSDTGIYKIFKILSSAMSRPVFLILTFYKNLILLTLEIFIYYIIFLFLIKSVKYIKKSRFCYFGFPINDVL